VEKAQGRREDGVSTPGHPGYGFSGGTGRGGGETVGGSVNLVDIIRIFYTAGDKGGSDARKRKSKENVVTPSGGKKHPGEDVTKNAEGKL